jgi:prepilin-type N-terminal cleavage/methylation domain-containing protein
MNKRAFTLVELLAVIVVLGVLLSIVTMSITKYMTAANNASYKSLVESIESSAELYVAENSTDFPLLDVAGSNFDIELNDLVNANYIKSDIIDKRTDTSIPLTTKVNITVISKDKINAKFMYN